MKNTNTNNLILSFVILVIFFCLISLIASPAEIRYSWQGINPWNSVLGLTYLLKRFLSVDSWLIYTLTTAIIIYLWWRINALVKRLRKS